MFKQKQFQKSQGIKKLETLNFKETQKELLKILLIMSTENRLNISRKKLGILIGVSGGEIFNLLKDFQKMGLIKIQKAKQVRKPNIISIKPLINKLNELIRLEEKYFGIYKGEIDNEI